LHRAGWVRKLDFVGRIVLPMDIRKDLGIEKHDDLEFSLQEQGIILIQLVKKQCRLCGSNHSLMPYRDSFVCTPCIRELKGI
jgi:transcriptional pleiotropic regulator of transition state genes